MADDKRGRDDQADREIQRQREREIEAELQRGDEPEPPVDTATLAFFETELDEVTFPATGAEIIETAGDREIEAETGVYTVAELLPETDVETFESPAAVRTRIQRPTIASAMKRIVEAAEGLAQADFRTSQRAAYERTFLELKTIDAVDDDEGISVVQDWIVEQIDEKGRLPGSRDVRRQAANYCRANGYQVSNDEWLGV